MKIRNISLSVLFITLASCSQKEPQNTDKVTILSSRGLHLIQPLLDEYSKETGQRVEVSNNKAGVLFSLIKNGSAKADLLLTTDLGSLVKASEEGLLETVGSDLEPSVKGYSDQEKKWFGLSRRTRVIFYNSKIVKEKGINLLNLTYESLGEERFKNSLCLRTSKKVYNQALVADFVDRYGEEKTLNFVKGWVKNLAAPVFASDREVIKAVSRGKCLFGIANSYYLGKLEEKSDLENVKILWSKDSPAHVNLSGIGLLKNASNQEGAKNLIKWLMSDKAQAMFASVNYEYPVNESSAVNDLLKVYGTPVVKTPTYLNDYSKLHEKALKLIKLAGYK